MSLVILFTVITGRIRLKFIFFDYVTMLILFFNLLYNIFTALESNRRTTAVYQLFFFNLIHWFESTSTN